MSSHPVPEAPRYLKDAGRKPLEQQVKKLHDAVARVNAEYLDLRPCVRRTDDFDEVRYHLDEICNWIKELREDVPRAVAEKARQDRDASDAKQQG